MLPTVFGTAELFAPIVEVYRQRWEETGRDWSDARVGACSHTHVGPASETARAVWEPFYRNYWDFVGTLLQGAGMWPTFDFDNLLAGPAICGDPDEVADRIGHWREVLGLDRHLFMFDLGGVGHPEVAATIELFADRVMPQLG